MNGYERFQAVCSDGEPDFPPRMPILMHFKARYLGVTYDRFAADPETKAEANLRCAREFGIDEVDVMSDPYVETHDFGGVIKFVPDGVPQCLKAPLQDTADLSALAKPDVRFGRMSKTVATIRLYRRRVFKELSIHGWVEGPAAEAGDLRGVEPFLLDLYEQPALCSDLMRLCTENAIRFACAQIAAGADVIGVGDAICSQISPSLYEQLIAPWQRQLFEAIHQAGGRVRLHICGSVMHLLHVIKTLPCDILDVDSLTDFAIARATLGSRIALAGNLNPVTEVMNATPETIRQAVVRCHAGAGRSYIVSAGCEIPAATPFENLRALCTPTSKSLDTAPQKLR